MPKSTQKCCSKGLVGIAAIGGLVVGAAVAHTFFMCPESQYPACYHDMVKAEFSAIQGAKYDLNYKWENGSLVVTGQSNILCPYKVRTRLVDASTSDSLGVKSTQVTDVQNGTFTVTFDKDEVPSSGDLIVLVGADAQATDDRFAIKDVMNEGAYFSQTPMNIDRP